MEQAGWERMIRNAVRLLWSFKAIADAAHRFQILRVPGVGFNFLAQAADVYIDRAWSNERRFFPHRVEELVAGKDSPAMGREIFQKTKFAHGGQDVAPGNLHSHRRHVDFKITEAQNFRSRLQISGTAQDRANTSDEFTGAERLGDVIVCAEFQPLDAVGLCGFCGQKDDRNCRERWGLANVMAEVEAINPGQHDVQKENSRSFTKGLRDQRSARDEVTRRKAGSPQIMRDEAADIFFVFNHEDHGRIFDQWVGSLLPFARICWQVHAWLQIAHKVTAVIARELILNVWVQCCGSVSLVLTNDEFGEGGMTRQFAALFLGAWRRVWPSIRL